QLPGRPARRRALRRAAPGCRHAVLSALRRSPGAVPAARPPPLRRRPLDGGRVGGVSGPVRPIGWTCAFSRLLYPACHGPEALPGPRRDRREGPGLVPGGDPQAVLRRADPRRAPRELRTAETLAADARVRGGTGHDRASADG